MTGGVSLAVWMGGIARELNLLQQASNLRRAGGMPASGGGSGSGGGHRVAAHDRAANGQQAAVWDEQCRDLYLNLLSLLDLTVTTDVLSGTSAGGINAALLGLSNVVGGDLGWLRDLWLATGSMDLLLRDPGEPNPPSLMQGDKVLFSRLDHAIRELYADRDKALKGGARDAASTTVFITTTMLAAETGRFSDGYGTQVPDVDHRGLFTFTDDALGANGAPALTELALAARSSASFPGAFEPSFVPIGSCIDATSGVPEHPDMAEYANMTRSHWVVDGGLLANRPLAPLLAKVFSQPADGQVRRLLAFIVPDGGGAPRITPEPVADDDWKHPMTLAGALKADVGAQLSQSIASDLEAIRSHNERIATRHDLRLYLADLGSRLRSGGALQPHADELVTRRVLCDYQRQQGASLAQPLLSKAMRQLTTMKIPPAWATELAPGQEQRQEPAEPRMARIMAQILGQGWQASQPGQPSPAGGAGAAAAERSPADEEAAAWRAWTAATDPFSRAALFGWPMFLAAQAATIELVRLGYKRATTNSQRADLAQRRKEIKDAHPGKPSARTDEHGKVRKYLQRAASLANSGHASDLVSVATDLAEQKRRDQQIGKPGPADLTAAWRKLACALQSLLADLQVPAAPAGRESRAEAAESIAVYARYFGSGPQPSHLADRLLKLLVAERAFLPADTELDQPVEFVQFSANTRTLLAPEDDSAAAPERLDLATKLRGVELHHFAAFYKSSWRAWDWMWGRLDGCGWLVHVLLDPRRILATVEDDPDAYPEKQRAKKFAAALRKAAGLPEGLQEDCLDRDLAFLDDHTAKIPPSLPNSALFLARAWQNRIAANELPAVADRIVADSGHLPPLIPPRGGQSASQPSPGQRKLPARTRTADRIRATWHQAARRHRRKKGRHAPLDPWVTNMLRLKDRSAQPEEFADQLPGCPVRQETLAGELRTPTFARLAAKAAAVGAAAVAAAPEAPGAVRPVLTGARSITRTGYMATKITGGAAWKTLLAGVMLAVVGGVMATQGMIVVGLSGTIIALAGLYLMALGAWGIHRGILGAIVAITALTLPALLTLHWVREKIWGTGKNTASGLVPRDVLPWLRSSWWGGLAIIGGIILIAVLISLIPRRRPAPNRAKKRSSDSRP